jgi:hypothetical protein
MSNVARCAVSLDARASQLLFVKFRAFVHQVDRRLRIDCLRLGLDQWPSLAGEAGIDNPREEGKARFRDVEHVTILERSLYAEEAIDVAHRSLPIGHYLGPLHGGARAFFHDETGKDRVDSGGDEIDTSLGKSAAAIADLQVGAVTTGQVGEFPVSRTYRYRIYGAVSRQSGPFVL